jgi:hypothetical protein
VFWIWWFAQRPMHDKSLCYMNEVKPMERVATHRISRQASKEAYSYPIVRLPKCYQSVVGSKAEIYSTEYLGRQAFLVVVDNLVDNSTCSQSKKQSFEGKKPEEVKSRISQENGQNQEERGCGGNPSTRCCYGDSNPSRERERLA